MRKVGCGQTDLPIVNFCGWLRSCNANHRSAFFGGWKSERRATKRPRIRDFSVFPVSVHQTPGPMSSNERRKCELPLLDDTCGDLFRDVLPISRSKGQLGFAWIGEKT